MVVPVREGMRMLGSMVNRLVPCVLTRLPVLWRLSL